MGSYPPVPLTGTKSAPGLFDPAAQLYQELEQRSPGETAWIYAVNPNRTRYQCTRYTKHGVRIILEHNHSEDGYESYYIRMIVNPRKLLDPKSSYLGILEPAKDAAKQIETAFGRLFRDTPFDDELDQYYLTRVDLCANVQCDNSKMFRELIRASQKQATPPKLERRYYENPDKKKEARYNKHYLHYACKSYELVIYDKTYQLTEAGLKLSYEKLPEGVLRYEMRLGREYIRTLEKKLDGPKVCQILQFLVANARPLLVSGFGNHFPAAQYVRLPELLAYLQNSRYPDHVRCQMQYLVETVSRCEGVDEAFAKMGKKKEEQKALLDRFRKRNVSPVPLRKNFSAMLLPNPSALLLQLPDPEGEPVRIPYVRIK